MTRCPIELQMKNNPDPNSQWEGRLSCQNERGQSISKTLRNPAEVGDEITAGRLSELTLEMKRKKIICTVILLVSMVPHLDIS